VAYQIHAQKIPDDLLQVWLEERRQQSSFLQNLQLRHHNRLPTDSRYLLRRLAPLMNALSRRWTQYEGGDDVSDAETDLVLLANNNVENEISLDGSWQKQDRAGSCGEFYHEYNNLNEQQMQSQEMEYQIEFEKETNDIVENDHLGSWRSSPIDDEGNWCYQGSNDISASVCSETVQNASHLLLDDPHLDLNDTASLTRDDSTIHFVENDPQTTEVEVPFLTEKQSISSQEISGDKSIYGPVIADNIEIKISHKDLQKLRPSHHDNDLPCAIPITPLASDEDSVQSDDLLPMSRIQMQGHTTGHPWKGSLLPLVVPMSSTSQTKNRALRDMKCRLVAMLQDTVRMEQIARDLDHMEKTTLPEIELENQMIQEVHHIQHKELKNLMIVLEQESLDLQTKLARLEQDTIQFSHAVRAAMAILLAMLSFAIMSSVGNDPSPSQYLVHHFRCWAMEHLRSNCLGDNNLSVEELPIDHSSYELR